jgi:hypothetical protein
VITVGVIVPGPVVAPYREQFPNVELIPCRGQRLWRCDYPELAEVLSVYNENSRTPAHVTLPDMRAWVVTNYGKPDEPKERRIESVDHAYIVVKV